ncbi:MAG: hypothetical protein JKY41_08840 [Rhodobacteraceae bacterium]|nr:hypothetical protein [Paracoccaceae bacterium]
MNESNAELTYSLSEVFIGGINLSISCEEYRGIAAAQKTLRALNDVEDLFSLIALSYTEIEKLMLEALVDYNTGNATAHGHFEFGTYFDELRTSLNLKLLTFLVAYTAFDHQLPQICPNISENGEQVYDNVKAAIRNEFDTSLSFRIACALRNHAQHSKLPLYGTSIGQTNQWRGGNPTSDEPSRSRVTLNPYISSAELAANKNIRPETRNQITSLNLENIDVKMLVRNFMQSIFNVQERFRELTNSQMTNATKIIDQCYETASKEKGNQAKFLSILFHSEGSETESINISDEFPLTVLRKRKMWTGLKHVSRCYLSSEPIHNKNNYQGSDELLWISK